MLARRSRVSFAFVAAFLFSSSALAQSSPAFCVEKAGAHISMLAGTIGSRPAGSDANRRAREYIISQLKAAGFDVRVQEADGQRRGLTAHVSNVIATKAGRRAQAIALLGHYDSVPYGPGAADDALGAAVCLEAGRALAGRADPVHALAVILTDGEENGLMGAAAVVKDPIMGWVRAVLNFDAVDGSGANTLFESGPQSGVLIDAWARHAWHPAGSSYMTDIYRLLPNDTDFTLFRRAGVPGLNFAAVGDSYWYHTSRDTPGRVKSDVVAQMGNAAVSIVSAIDANEDLGDPSRDRAVYFDVVHRWAVSYSARTALVLFAAALLAALFGWLTVLSAARRTAGWRATMLTAVWTAVGVVAVFGTMVAATWLLRATRESYHPWYSHPDRFFLYLVAAGALGAWVIRRVGQVVPPGARGSTHPAVTWAITIPSWMALTIAAQIVAPSASYLFVIPLLVAGIALTVSPIGTNIGMRVVSIIVFLAVAALWVRDALELLGFAVPMFGRMAFVTPVYVYPAFLIGCGLLLAPPVLAFAWRAATVTAWQKAFVPGAFVFAAGWCWFAPAYTSERPLQATVSYVNDVAAGSARWQMASNDALAAGSVATPASPGTWRAGAPPRSFGWPIESSLGPFRYYEASQVVDPPPMTVTGSVTHELDASWIEVRALPQRPGLGVQIRLPAGVLPEETNLAGTEESGSVFVARYFAVPPGGVTFRARISSEDARKLEAGGNEARAVTIVTAPGLPGAEWPRLPTWLRQDAIVWHARSYFVVPVELTVAKGVH